MGEYNWIGFGIVATLSLAVTLVLIGQSRKPAWFRRLIACAVLLHIVGTLARYYMIFGLYGRVSDAVGYYKWGERFAAYLYDRKFAALFEQPFGGRWWGTHFVRVVSGFVVAVIGPTFAGEALVFSLLSMIGLVLVGLAFWECFPDRQARQYQTYILLWPSLWFWPSSVGKDALLLFAIGLMTYGYVGRANRPHLLFLAAGALFALAIRPHIVALLGVAMAVAEVLGQEGGSRWLRWARTAAICALGLLAVWLSLRQLGLAEVEGEGQSLVEFVEFHSKQTVQGGSQIETARGAGLLLGVPIALVNALFRPFLFEARHAGMLLAALEMTVFWILVYRRRKAAKAAFKSWRQNRFLRFALPCSFILALAFGMVFGNLGIIARQRISIFLFLFAFLAAGAHALPRRRRVFVLAKPPLRYATRTGRWIR